MGNIGAWEIALIVLVLLLLFGPKRLPQMGRSLGRGMREFKDSVFDQTKELKEATIDVPKQIKQGLDPFAEEKKEDEKPATQIVVVQAPAPEAVAPAPQTPVAEAAPPPAPEEPIAVVVSEESAAPEDERPAAESSTKTS